MHVRTFAMCGALGLMANVAAAPERVDVAVDSVEGPVTHRGSGFIQGPFSDDQPGDDVITPLKVRRFRGTEKDVVSAYKRCKANGATMEVVSNNWNAWDKTPMGVNGDWTAWETYHSSRRSSWLD